MKNYVIVSVDPMMDNQSKPGQGACHTPGANKSERLTKWVHMGYFGQEFQQVCSMYGQITWNEKKLAYWNAKNSKKFKAKKWVKRLKTLSSFHIELIKLLSRVCCILGLRYKKSIKCKVCILATVLYHNK